MLQVHGTMDEIYSLIDLLPCPTKFQLECPKSLCKDCVASYYDIKFSYEDESNEGIKSP